MLVYRGLDDLAHFFSHPLRARHPSTQRCGGRRLQCRFGPGLQYLPAIHFQRMAQINQVGAFKAAHIPLNRRPRNAVSLSGNRLKRNNSRGNVAQIRKDAFEFGGVSDAVQGRSRSRTLCASPFRMACRADTSLLTKANSGNPPTPRCRLK